MWRLAREVAETELNRGVLRFFANACLARLVHADPARVEELVLILFARAGDPQEKPTQEILEEIGTLVAVLWVSHARPEAERLLKEWLRAIPGHEPELSHAMLRSRRWSLVPPGTGEECRWHRVSYPENWPSWRIEVGRVVPATAGRHGSGCGPSWQF